LGAVDYENDRYNLPVQPASQWTDVHLAAFGWLCRHRGGEILTSGLISKKPAIASQSRVFCLTDGRPVGRPQKRHMMKKNAKYRKVPTRFGPDTRFEVKPVPAALVRAEQHARLAGLKDQLLEERLNEVPDPASEDHFRHAAAEAAALAWVTPYPLLVFPVLFDEKARDAEYRLERQEQVRQRSRELLAV
jgi:hypothetical protein